MRICYSEDDLDAGYITAQKFGESYFDNAAVYLEKYISSSRHIEVQVFGDGQGHVIALGERDCSIQRRFQKIVEETPSPFVDEKLREKLYAAAIRLCKQVNYRSSGTVEFLVDSATGEFYFLEFNTRLQVEHAITEEVTGIDIVELMIMLAAGHDLNLQEYAIYAQGHAIEVRLYAENPATNFLPGTGVLTQVLLPQHTWARYDFGVKTGSVVPSYYDPLLGKIIVSGRTRRETLVRLKQTLQQVRIAGIPTNLDYLLAIISADKFVAGDATTEFLTDFTHRSATIEVLSPGLHTTIQDLPGREKYWRVGVPPSGPMDDLAFQIANALIGNDLGTAALEFTLSGPTLRFHDDTVIAFTGADMACNIDGVPVEWYTPIAVNADSVLVLGDISGFGMRSYMAIRGGINVPDYLGSKSTFSFGLLGGLDGGAIKTGDIIPFAKLNPAQANGSKRVALPPSRHPKYHTNWQIGVIYGPHGAPDFFTEQDIQTFFETQWRVHYNSNRLGIRLIGPKPQWARKDGGEAGLHPSNIHDCEYAIGTVNFTGDMPIILAKDGPSLGGFVCPVTIVQSELWKIGQIATNDRVQFKRISYESALRQKQQQFEYLEQIKISGVADIISQVAVDASVSQSILLDEMNSNTRYPDAISHIIEEQGDRPRVTYRIAGDNYLLIEYGPLELDLANRFRVEALINWFDHHPVKAIKEFSPGVRSVQVHYDSQKLHLDRLIEILILAEGQLPSIGDMKIDSRILRIPLAFDDKWNRSAIERYRCSITSSVPYLPSNIDFIARINGLADADEVCNIVLDASYLVLGLGDVYLGAPCAVPIDPIHRLVTSKYNPARTYTPEGAVGIGGVYMCIYGMDSPGGYQLVGRTLPIWNKFTDNANFEAQKPWLLRCFDQVQYYLVSDEELEKLREQFISGKLMLDIKKTTLSMDELKTLSESNANEISQFKKQQAVAFSRERRHWQETGMIGDSKQHEETVESVEDIYVQTALPKGFSSIHFTTGGVVLDIWVETGQEIEQGQEIAVIEAMKMEIKVFSPSTGFIEGIKAKKGQLVAQGNMLAIVRHK